MSDERIERLTELARGVWPDIGLVVASTGQAAGVHERGGEERMLAMLLCHPRALDALEAALLVLAGDSDFYKRNYEQAEEECTRERERADNAEAREKRMIELGEEQRLKFAASETAYCKMVRHRLLALIADWVRPVERFDASARATMLECAKQLGASWPIADARGMPTADWAELLASDWGRAQGKHEAVVGDERLNMNAREFAAGAAAALGDCAAELRLHAQGEP